jgi:hypothetical protein
MRATCPTHLILDLIIIIISEVYELCIVNQSPSTSPPPLYILLSNLFSDTFYVCTATYGVLMFQTLCWLQYMHAVCMDVLLY